MRKTLSSLGVPVAVSLALAAPVAAQTEPLPAEEQSGFSGYIRKPLKPGDPSSAGAQSGSTVPEGATSRVDPRLTDGTEASQERVDGFNEAVEQAFPMTPEMIRRYREIFEASEEAMLERVEPKVRIDTGFIALEPGEPPPELVVAPGIASVIGIYDATGQAWPIKQYVIGSVQDFQVTALGEEETGNNVVVTPLVRVGWSNLVLSLEGIPKPVVMRIRVSEDAVHYRHDIQVMRHGPNAVVNTAATEEVINEAGSAELLAALSGVDLPPGSKPVPVRGVDARGWMIGERLFLRSRHALLSPSWLGSMSGPDGIRVYEINPASVALFSVDGAIVRADVELP